MAPLSLTLSFTAFAVGSVLGQYTATYAPNDATLPVKSHQLQTGTNKCGTGNSQNSQCQNVFINSASDFCVWGPPYSDGRNATVGVTEKEVVSWCTRPGYGTRLIPDGTLQGVHFVETPEYVQISGIGDFTRIGIPADDYGGELDPHGADGNGNPPGGLVFGDNFGRLEQYHEWTSFMSSQEFCFRACKNGPMAATYCEHRYDTMGCRWNMPANYLPGAFEDCKGDTGEPMGIYRSVVNGVTVTSTYARAASPTPSAHPVPSSSDCVAIPSPSAGVLAPASITPIISSAPSATPRPSSRAAITTRSSSASASAGADSAENAAGRTAAMSWHMVVGVVTGLMIGGAVVL